MLLVCFAVSSEALTTLKLILSSFAFCFAPSERLTKNGLFKVETDNPTVILLSLTFSRFAR